MADDLIPQHIALLEHIGYNAAFLAVLCGYLLHRVHGVGVKLFAQRLDLADVQLCQCLLGLIQGHAHALFVVFIGTRGVGGHIQRIQDSQDLVYGMAHAVAELLVSLPGAALAEVFILGSGAQQPVFGFGSLFFGSLCPGLSGLQLGSVLFAALFFFILFGGSFGFCFGCLLGGRCGLFGLLSCLLDLFAHSSAS